VFSVRLVLSQSILQQSVYKTLGKSYSLKACKKKQCFLVVNILRKASDQAQFVKIKSRLTTREEREVQVKVKGRLYTCFQRLVALGRDRLG
jgi:hypothetical protein